MSAKRINALRKKLRESNLDGLIVTHLDFIRYLTGFSGSAGLLVIGSNGAEFLTDFRYKDQSRKEVAGARVHIARGGDLLEGLKDLKGLADRNTRYGIDAAHLTLAQHTRLRKVWPGVLLANAEDVLADLGWVKEPEELAAIRKAAAVSDTAFERVLSLVAPGIRERELAAELEYQMMMLGSSKPAFETIVASGWRAALPHGAASDKKIEKGDFITFDFGATIDGYVSDITRTVVVGKASPRQRKIYDIVLRAQLAGIRKVRAGVAGKAVDNVCRGIIKRAGYDKHFGHGTGHGIGYYVHVGPRLSPLSNDILQPNNVVTVEPGIYISGWGGVRIEDDVVGTRGGGKVLNRAPKNLLEL
ncbi:MAG: Xaa-Pro peptidase family protein [candidate division Zixibacteria bacterium]|nr:Xaa-Pro peptidase family protein [candidate division Zixibacteria bacterium]